VKYSILKVLSFASAMIVLSGCDSELVSSVKNAQYDGGFSVEEIFEDSGYCASVEWSETEVEHKRYGKLVHMECVISDEHKVFKEYKTLVFNFKNVNGTVDIFNSYVKNEEGKQVGGISRKWQSEMQMAGMFALMQ